MPEIDNDKNKNTYKKPAPLDWRGVGALAGAGLGSFLGMADDHLIIYTLIGAGAGFFIGCCLSFCFKKQL